MPPYWYSYRGLTVKDEDDPETIATKAYNRRVVSPRKPYFMTYIYPTLKSDLKKFDKAVDGNSVTRFHALGVKNYQDLLQLEDQTDEIIAFIDWCEDNRPVGQNPCVVNRISKIFEQAFKNFSAHKLNDVPFDCSILRNDAKYSKQIFNTIYSIYQSHRQRCIQLAKVMSAEKHDKYYAANERIRIIELFQRECYSACSSMAELANVVIDICYQSESLKQFAWDICGDYFVEHLLVHNDGMIQFPVLSQNETGDFYFCGKSFEMRSKQLEAGDLAE